MTTVAGLLEHLDRAAPFALAAGWDPVGLQLGDPAAEVFRAAVCHEVTGAVVEQIGQDPPDVLVSYHPLLFEPIRSLVTGSTPAGRALELARLGVALVVVHTAFDVAPGGAAEALADALGLGDLEPLFEEDDPLAPAIGRVGTTSQSLDGLAARVRESLGAAVRVADPGRLQPLSLVAVVPGSGAGFIEAALAAGADALVTGDVSHHRAQQAKALGLAVIDAGHVPTERPGLTRLVELVGNSVNVVDLTVLDPHPWEMGNG